MKGRKLRISLVASAVVSAGCSLDFSAPKEPPVTPTDLSKVSYTLTLNRASMTGQDFERYKLLPAGLFAECGIVYRGRPEIQSQVLEHVHQDLVAESRQLAKEIQQKYIETEPHTVDARGSSSGFADPGIFTLTVVDGTMRTEISTSVDWVEQRRGALAGLIHQFTRVVRGLTAEPLCGNSQFYGIGRREESSL